jgi:CRP/FNR family transcriptional regulator
VRSIPHLETLSDEEARRFAQELVVRSYAPRELIALEGAPNHGFFLLRSGRARIFRSGAEGREQILRLLHPGHTFGEVPVFDHGPQPANVEALEHCEAILVPAESFRRLVHQHPDIAIKMLGHFARRIRSFTYLVEQISLQSVHQRIARYLYFAAREEGIPSPEGIVVPRTITQQDLAALVGSVREVVSRTLKVMEDDGIIEVRRREFLVRDLDALHRLV